MKAYTEITMPYCQDCKTEYRTDITQCADCGGELTSAWPTGESNEPFVEVFSTDNREDIETARQVLGEAEIEHFVRDLAGNAFPTHMGDKSECRIAVSASQLQVAHSVIQEAMEDGAITPSGALLA
jgi:hypothetical protein